MSFLRHVAAVGIVLVAVQYPFVASGDSSAVRIFAAASLVDLLADLEPQLEAEIGQNVVISSASSATLARQIALGAEADIFISANPHWIDYLVQRNEPEKKTASVPWLSNVLVCVVPADSTLELWSEEDLTPEKVSTLALAAEAVPLGIYSREALTAAAVPGGKRVVSGSDARDTLRKVSLGAADAGIVYATDAKADPRVRVAFELCPDSYTSVAYPVLCTGENPDACKAVEGFLFGPAARLIIASHGFILLE